MQKLKILVLLCVTFLVASLPTSAVSATTSNVIVVQSGGSIASAIKSITDASVSNTYTIKVKAGVYKETFTTKNYVDIIGESPYTTIIDYTGTNPDPMKESTIFAASTTKLENLTIRAKNAKYPVHSDAGNTNAPYNLVINNCILEHLGLNNNGSGTPIGIGLYQNQHIEIYDSELIGFGAGSSGVYIHNQYSTAGIGFRSLRVENTEIKGVSYGIRVNALPNTANQANDAYLIGNNIQALTAEIFIDAAQTDSSWHIKANGNTLSRIWQPNNTHIVEQPGFTKRVRNYGVNLERGSVVTLWDTGAVGTTNKENSPLVVGVSLENIPNGKEGVIQISGWVNEIKVNGPVNGGSFLVTSIEQGVAKMGDINWFAIAKSTIADGQKGVVSGILLPMK